MTTFKPSRILVPVDFTETSTVAFRAAQNFATRFDAEILALFADSFLPPVAYADIPVTWYSENLEEMKNMALNRLVEYAKQNAAPGTKWEARVAADTPVHAILNIAHTYGADMIVMGTHGYSGWRRALLGSVTESVLHEIDIPVLTVRHRADAPTGGAAKLTRILCPVNYSDVARDALIRAGAIADAFDAEIYVLNVVEAAHHEPHEGEMDELREWIPHEVRHRCSYKELVIHGHAAETVLDLAHKLETDLIVLGAQHKRFADTTVIGTTTERIIRHAYCPVLTVVRKVGASPERTGDQVTAESLTPTT